VKYNSYIIVYIYMHIITVIIVVTSSTAQGGGGSFRNRKPIGEIGCCESGMAERIHCNHSSKHNSNHLSVHQWIGSAISDSQQPSSPIGFLFLKLPPPPCADYWYDIMYHFCLTIQHLYWISICMNGYSMIVINDSQNDKEVIGVL